MSLGEPVPLGVIACHLEAEDWLDMHVCDLGKLDRVQISQLNIKRDADEVVVRQKWLEEEGGAYEVRNEHYQFDAEDIIWLRETRVAFEDVKPPSVKREQPTVGEGLSAKAIIDEIVRAVAFTHAMTEAELRKPLGKGDKSLHARQLAMFLAYEMTDENPDDIGRLHFGYKSQQPVITIHQKVRCSVKHNWPVRYGERPQAWLQMARKTAKIIDTKLGQQFRRQTHSWGAML